MAKPQMPDYEQTRLENIKKNNEILRSLGLENQEPVQQKPKPKSKSQPKRKSEVIEPVRKSLRMRGEAPEIQIAAPVELQDRPQKENIEEIDDKPFFNINETEDKKLTEMAGKYQDFKIPIDEGTCKITGSMIQCITVMPSTRLIAACGDRDGRISIWDIDDVLLKCQGDQEDLEPSVYSYKKHSRAVMKLVYHPQDNTKLYSSAYGGAINCFDSSAQSCDLV